MQEVGKVIGIRRDAGNDEQFEKASEQELLHDADFMDVSFIEADVPQNDREPTIRAVLLGGAVIWAGFSVWLYFGRGHSLPTVESVPMIVMTVITPLILLALIYLILTRSSSAEARRFGTIARSMREESDALDARMSEVGAQLLAARDLMREQAEVLQSYGAAASANLEASARIVASHTAEMAQNISQADKTGTALDQKFQNLIALLPQLEERAAGMSGQLNDSGHALSERIDALENRLHLLGEFADDARTKTLAATKSFASQLIQLQEGSRSTSEEISGLADLASKRIETAIRSSKLAMEETGAKLDSHSEALESLVERARATVESVSQDGVSAFAEQTSDIETRLHQLAQLMTEQVNLASGLGEGLSTQVEQLEERFAALESDGIARNERLANALSALSSEGERMSSALTSGNDQAERMIATVESLLLALDSGVREMDETIPAALARMGEKIGRTNDLASASIPELEKVEAIADAILGKTHEAERMLAEQSQSLGQWLDRNETAMASNQDKVAELREVLDSADDSAVRLHQSAGPQLVAALLRVRDTAEQASEKARNALSRAIPEAAEALGEATEAAMRQAVDERVSKQLQEVSVVAERAVKAAHQASDRLMRQLLTIAETSTQIEQRIEEAEREAEERDRDSFARRSAILIESLNSIAIDVAKLLSNEIGDPSWAAYLKGDRGVFTRRAVKLLDAGEAREVALHYERDPEFREHVNRYIHDFEAMLRTILSARDGSALGVTLLSSDMGKLYVALAQAIERLRT